MSAVETSRLDVPIHTIGNGVLYEGDSLEVMAHLPSEHFKAIITSPPYNLRESSGGFWSASRDTGRLKQSKLRSDKGYTDHDDAMPREEYVAWQRACLTEMMRLLRPDGALFYNHKDRPQHGLLESPDEIVSGFPVRQRIIWERPGGQNFNDPYYVPSHEFIYLIVQPDFKLLPGECRHGTVWRFPPARIPWHPAPFPLTLPKRILSTIGEGPVLDPFMGSGTTAVAAEQAGRSWVGIENSNEFCEKSSARISSEASQGKLF